MKTLSYKKKKINVNYLYASLIKSKLKKKKEILYISNFNTVFRINF